MKTRRFVVLGAAWAWAYVKTRSLVDPLKAGPVLGMGLGVGQAWASSVLVRT